MYVELEVKLKSQQLPRLKPNIIIIIILCGSHHRNEGILFSSVFFEKKSFPSENRVEDIYFQEFEPFTEIKANLLKLQQIVRTY